MTAFTAKRRLALLAMQDDIRIESEELAHVARRAVAHGLTTTTTHQDGIVFKHPGGLVHLSDTVEANNYLLRLPKKIAHHASAASATDQINQKPTAS